MRNLLAVLLISTATSALISCGGGGGSSNPPAVVVPPPPPPAPPPPPPPPTNVGPATCMGGMAGIFPCNGLDLRKRVPKAELGGGDGNDIWGWTDPMNGDEYALVGMTTGTAFVRITDPENPVVVGRIPTHTVSATWRDIKVYDDHAFIVADNAGAHGMQVFDLTRLRGITDNRVFTTDAHYSGVTNTHNIVINPTHGYAYLVGSNTCDKGLHIVDIRAPLSPAFVACNDTQPKTHDAQCVDYVGPDTDHTGKEICIAGNADSFGVTDVTVKAVPTPISNTVYPGLGFVHQVWFDETQTYVLINDELDETEQGVNATTIVLDLTDLDNPQHLYSHRGTKSVIDHNLYIKGNRVYESNYQAGLQVLEFTDLATDTLTEVMFFDTYPEDDMAVYNGNWSNYPYFPSGNIVLSDIDRGLFILTPQ